MELGNDKLRELLSVQTQPLISVPPLIVEQTQTIQSLKNVHQEYCFGLVFGKDFSSGAKMWSEYKDTPYMFVLFTLMLAIQDGDMGSIFINISKEQSPRKYQSVLRALARQFLCLPPEVGANDRIKKFVIPCQYINTTQLMDIQEMIEKVREEEENKKNKNKNKKKKKDDEDEEDEEEEEQREEEEFMEVVVPDFEDYMKRPIVYRETGPRILMRRRITAALDDLALLVPLPDGKETVMPKVSPTVTPIPNKEGKIIGILVRLLVHDKAWNPGEMIEKLIAQCNTRMQKKHLLNYREPWMEYKDLIGTRFPAFCMSLQTWFDAINAIYGITPTSESFKQQAARSERVDCFTSTCHPISVCNLERALKLLNDAGGLYCNNSSAYIGNNRVATFPKQLKTYCYTPEQFVWANDMIMGLRYQYFPNMCNTKNTMNKKLLDYLKNHRLIVKNDVMSLITKNTEFKTNNMFIHAPLDADVHREKVMELMPKDCYTDMYLRYTSGEAVDMEPYDKYCKELEKTNQMWLDNFKNIFSLDGNAWYLNVSEPLKNVVNWIQERFEKRGNIISRDIFVFDKSMNVYSNYLVSILAQYRNIGKCLLPHIMYEFQATFSVYRRRYLDSKELVSCFLLHGSPNDGKSNLVNGFAKMCIDGTHKLTTTETDKSGETDTHEFDLIIVRHETPEEYVKVSEGKKKANKVNQKKSAMSEGKTVTVVHERVVVNGMAMRTNRESVRATHVAEINISNSAPDEKAALAQRFRKLLSYQSEIPMHHFWNPNQNTQEYKDMEDHFRITQFLEIQARKQMAVFAVPCDKIFMGLFNLISGKMIDTLHDWGILDSKSVSGRILSLMRNEVEGSVLKKSFVYTFHMEGAQHHNKPFYEEQMKDCAPFWYAGIAETLFAWTLYSSEFIKEEYGSVLKAAAQIVLNTSYDVKKSPLEYFFEDTDNKIMFKTDPNVRYRREEDKALNKLSIDLNMFQILGSVSEVANKIAPLTENPCLKADVVADILVAMSSKPFIPLTCNGKRNGYVQDIPLDDLKNTHRGIKTFKTTLTIQDFKNSLRQYADSVRDTLYLKVLQRMLPDMNPMNYRTPEQARQIFADVESVDLLLMYINRKKNLKFDSIERAKEWIKTIKNAKCTRDKIQLDDMERIVKSFSNVVATSPYDIEGMDYKSAQIILYIIRNGIVFKEPLKVVNFQTLLMEYAKSIITQMRSTLLHLKEDDLIDLLFLYVNDVKNVTRDTKDAVMSELSKKPLDMKTIVRHFPDVTPGIYSDVVGLDLMSAQLVLYGFKKKIFNEYGVEQNYYLKRSQTKDANGFSHIASEYDINQLHNVPLRKNGNNVKHNVMNVVDISNRKRVCFCPMAIPMFDPTVIIEAFNYATISPTFPPGKYLTGWPQKEIASLLKVIEYTPEYIAEKSKAFDLNAPAGATLRQGEGILFKVVDYMEDDEATLVRGINNPIEVNKTKNFEIIKDLDAWAATQQHLICGRPFNEPVRTPQWIEEHLYTGQKGDMNYPETILKKRQTKVKANWDPNGAVSNKRSREIAGINLK